MLWEMQGQLQLPSGGQHLQSCMFMCVCGFGRQHGVDFMLTSTSPMAALQRTSAQGDMSTSLSGAAARLSSRFSRAGAQRRALCKDDDRYTTAVPTAQIFPQTITGNKRCISIRFECEQARIICHCDLLQFAWHILSRQLWSTEAHACLIWP
jgi:hypothetical protein